MRIAIDELKRNAPIAGHTQAVQMPPFAFQAMQKPAGNIQLLDLIGLINGIKQSGNTRHLRRLQNLGIAAGEEQLKALVPERLYHDEL